jgi:CheY-like chemotaxis protein
MMKTILVVEDNDNLRHLLSAQLELIGYSVLEAHNGQEALELFEKKHPDLILMDMSMPVLDGLTATRKIRERGEHVPIVACSAFDKQYRMTALEAGCNEFVEKPIDAMQLMSAIGRYIR